MKLHKKILSKIISLIICFSMVINICPQITSFAFAAETENENLSVWTANPLEQYFKTTECPEINDGTKNSGTIKDSGGVLKSRMIIDIHSAKNEYESYQILLRGKEDFITTGVTFSDLTNGTDVISKDNLSYNFQEYMRIDNTNIKDWPDPLSNDPEQSVEKDTTQSIWVTSFVPKDTAEGIYSGTATVQTTLGDVVVDIKLSVYDVTIPDTKDAEFSYGLWNCQVLRWADHTLESTDFIKEQYGYELFSDDWWDLIDEMAENLNESRANFVTVPLDLIMFGEGTDVNPRGIYSFGWDKFDKFVETFLDKGNIKMLRGFSLLEACNDPARVFLISKDNETGELTLHHKEINSPESQSFLNALLPALKQHLDEKGWTDMWYQSISDEAQEYDSYKTAVEMFRKYFGEDSKIIDAVMGNVGSEFNDLIDIWIPSTGAFNQNKAFYNSKFNQKDKEVWTYVCGAPPIENTKDAPDDNGLNRAITNPYCHPRLLNWGCFTNNLTGFYHWGYDHWSIDDTNIFSFTSKTLVPGDGWIIYPDRDNATIKNSIRVISTRDGAEDYEIFKILQQKDAQTSLSIASSIAKGFNKGEYVSDPVKIIEARKKLLSYFGEGYNNPESSEVLSQFIASADMQENGQVKVSWSNVEDADSYKVKYSMTGDELVHEMSVESENEVMLNLVPGFSYDITVEAYNGDTQLFTKQLNFIVDKTPSQPAEGGELGLIGYPCAFKAGPKPVDVNLSAGNPLDWAKYGETGSLSVERKSGVENQIGMIPLKGGYGQVTDSEIYFTWNDGTTSKTCGDITKEHSGSKLGSVMLDGAGKTGEAWAVTAPAGKETKILTIYTGSFACDISVTASLSDGSAVPVTYTSSSDTNDYQKINIAYKAASDNQMLVVKGSVTNKNNSWANMCLFASVLNDLSTINKPDVSLLNEKISEAENIKPDGYISESYKSLQKEINNAKIVVNAVTSEKEVTIALEKLQNAIDSLVAMGDLKFDKLDEIIKQAESIDTEIYTEESCQNLQEAVKKAKEDRDTFISQSDIDKAAEDLQSVLDALTKISDVKEAELSELVSICKNVKATGYSEDTFKAFQDAVKEAETSLTAGAEDIQTAYDLLQMALDKLEYTITDKVIYEFEDAIRLGNAQLGDADWAQDYSGSGYVRRIANVGDGVRVLAGSKNGGKQRIDIRYVRGMDTSATLGLFVNNMFVRHLEYPGTSSWQKDWQTISYVVDLKPGLNVIDIKRCKGNGDVDIDSLTLYPDNADGIIDYWINAVETEKDYKLDGSLIGWNLDTKLDKVIIGPKNQDNNKTRFGVKYDSNNLYIGIKIEDAVKNFNPIKELYNNDSIEMYIDAKNSKLQEGANPLILSLGCDGSVVKANKEDFPTNEIKSSAVTTDDGYSMEIAIPWKALNIEPKSEWNIGFDLFNNDCDENNVSTIGWSGSTSNFYGNTMQYGTLTFKFPQTDKTTLNSIIEKYSNLKPDNYVKTKWQAFEQALNNAKAVLAYEYSVQSDIDSAIDALNKAAENLNKTDDNTNSHSNSHSHSHSRSSSKDNDNVPTKTYISDTTSDFSVNSTYQFKITSKNGKAPSLVVGTPGVFKTKFVKKSGNDYYFKIIAVGKAGAKAGIYVNGQKLLAVTIKSTKSNIKCDTTRPFNIKAGKTYVFKLTANTKPTFVAASAFKVDFIKSSGNNYFFKVTAVGKNGEASGFYINSEKNPVTVARITK